MANTRGKKYIESKKIIDAKKLYTIEEGVELAKKASFSKFDGTLEIAIKLNLDTTKAEQQLRGNISLPYYFGKTTKILVLDDSLTAEAAKAANIDHFGGMDQIQKIKEG
jgi:large subunit ribosomal protein L1